jgi:membrane-bound ClpP family serine protease
MKKLLNIFGYVFALVGIIWILQGVNILPGSFMTGQIKWAWYGGITLVIGIYFLLTSRSKK